MKLKQAQNTRKTHEIKTGAKHAQNTRKTSVRILRVFRYIRRKEGAKQLCACFAHVLRIFSGIHNLIATW